MFGRFLWICWEMFERFLWDLGDIFCDIFGRFLVYVLQMFRDLFFFLCSCFFLFFFCVFYSLFLLFHVFYCFFLFIISYDVWLICRTWSLEGLGRSRVASRVGGTSKTFNSTSEFFLVFFLVFVVLFMFF